jgi:c-di-GMP-related signal transduction protein
MFNLAPISKAFQYDNILAVEAYISHLFSLMKYVLNDENKTYVKMMAPSSE